MDTIIINSFNESIKLTFHPQIYYNVLRKTRQSITNHLSSIKPSTISFFRSKRSQFHITLNKFRIIDPEQAKIIDLLYNDLAIEHALVSNHTYEFKYE